MIYLLGAILMTVGAGISLLTWESAPYIYSMGALGFASMQMLQRYEGQNFNIKRLRRMMLVSDVQPAKLSFNSIVTPSGIVTAVSPVEFLNAW